MTTMQNLQDTFSDMYKDVFGFRPLITESEWNDPYFLAAEIVALEEIIGKMTDEEMQANGWSKIEADDEPELDDGEALASAGWGTDEDYGYAGDVL